MSNKTVKQQRVARTASKQDRERDAVIAMQEYEAEKAAVLVKTARLRAIRLANEAKAQANAQAAEQAADAAAATKSKAAKGTATKVAAKRRPAAKKTAPKR
jgi:hypothetical protein